MKNNRYRLTLPMVRLYYNVLGIDESQAYYESVELNVRMIEEISPIKKYNLTDMFSYQLDDNMVLLLEKVSDLRWRLSKEEQEEYLSAVNVILKAVTNLNLIKDENYVLLYKRISYLLIITLSELITFSIDDTILLRKAIDSGSYNEINKFTNLKPITSLILLLSMNPNDVCDYSMYDKDEFVIGHYEFKNGIHLKLGEVIKMIEQNKWETTDIEFDDTTFKRLSLKKSIEMME